MKKIAFILVFVAVSVAMFSQTHEPTGGLKSFSLGAVADDGNGTDLRSGGDSMLYNFWALERMFIDTLGMINVVSEGADNTGSSDVSTIFESVADLAVSTGRNIYIPPGTYLFTDSAVFHDGCHVTAKGANFVIQGDITAIHVSEEIRDFSWMGGNWTSTGGNVGTAFSIIAFDINDDMVKLELDKMKFDNLRTALRMRVYGNGYATAFQIHNLWIWECVDGIELYGGASSYSTNYSGWSNIMFNAGPSTNYSMTVYGSGHQMSNMFFYDHYNGNTGYGYGTIHFAPSSSHNYITGRGIAPLVNDNRSLVGYLDEGTGNRIISDGIPQPWRMWLNDAEWTNVYRVSLPDSSTAALKMDYTIHIRSQNYDSLQVAMGTVRAVGWSDASTDDGAFSVADTTLLYDENVAGLSLNTQWTIWHTNGFLILRANFDTNIPSNAVLRLEMDPQHFGEYNAEFQ